MCVKMNFICRFILVCCLVWFQTLPTKGDHHWGNIPPLPELTVNHFPAMGIVQITFISDSTVDVPVWYILEVKQTDEFGRPAPEAPWWRPFNPLQVSDFNELVTIELRYRNAAGGIFPWFKAEMVRILVMWGA